MGCSNNTMPIDGASTAITLTETPQALPALIGGAIPTGATRAVIHFNLAPAGKKDPLGRMARDGSFVPTASVGEQIFQGSKKVLTESQFGATMRAVSDTIDAFVEFFEEEA